MQPNVNQPTNNKFKTNRCFEELFVRAFNKVTKHLLNETSNGLVTYMHSENLLPSHEITQFYWLVNLER